MKTFIYEEELDYTDRIAVIVAKNIHRAYEILLEENERLPMYFDEISNKYISQKSILFEISNDFEGRYDVHPYEGDEQ